MYLIRLTNTIFVLLPKVLNIICANFFIARGLLLLRLKQMLYYALCLSYHSNAELFCLHVFHQVGPPQRADCLVPRWETALSVFFKDTVISCCIWNRTKASQPFDCKSCLMANHYAMKAYYKMITHLVFISITKKLDKWALLETHVLNKPTFFPVIFIIKTLQLISNNQMPHMKSQPKLITGFLQQLLD